MTEILSLLIYELLPESEKTNNTTLREQVDKEEQRHLKITMLC